MFTAPKRHTYHDFPPSLAQEYLLNVSPWDIPKSWNRRQVCYAEEFGTSVVHDAINHASEGVILEFCKILGDTTNSKARLPKTRPSPLTYAIAKHKSFDLIYEMVKINGNTGKADNWLSFNVGGRYGVISMDHNLSTYAAVTHPDLRLVSAMLDAGLSFDKEDLYIALLFSKPETFKLLLRRTSKKLDWMKVVKFILEEYSMSYGKTANKPLVANMDEVQINLTNLVIEQKPTTFHQNFLIEKASSYKDNKGVLDYFYSAGFR